MATKMLPWAVWYLRGDFARCVGAVLTCMQEGGDFVGAVRVCKRLVTLPTGVSAVRTCKRLV